MAEWQCNACFSFCTKAPRKKTCPCGRGVFERVNPLPPDVGGIDEVWKRVCYVLMRGGATFDESKVLMDALTQQDGFHFDTVERMRHRVYGIWSRLRTEDNKKLVEEAASLNASEDRTSGVGL